MSYTHIYTYIHICIYRKLNQRSSIESKGKILVRHKLLQHFRSTDFSVCELCVTDKCPKLPIIVDVKRVQRFRSPCLGS